SPMAAILTLCRVGFGGLPVSVGDGWPCDARWISNWDAGQPSSPRRCLPTHQASSHDRPSIAMRLRCGSPFAAALTASTGLACSVSCHDEDTRTQEWLMLMLPPCSKCNKCKLGSLGITHYLNHSLKLPGRKWKPSTPIFYQSDLQ